MAGNSYSKKCGLNLQHHGIYKTAHYEVQIVSDPVYDQVIRFLIEAELIMVPDTWLKVDALMSVAEEYPYIARTGSRAGQRYDNGKRPAV